MCACSSSCQGVNGESKGKYLVLHVTAGLLALVLPILTAATGIQEKTEFVDRFGCEHPFSPHYTPWSYSMLRCF